MIIFIDDNIDQAEALERLCAAETATVLSSFDDLVAEDIEKADLIVVDFSVDDWSAKDASTELCLRPQDGLAVTETLRSYLRSVQAKRPVAFAVLSGELSKLTFPFEPSRREHMVAGLARVEWAFQKASPIEASARQLLSLASAVKALPPSWPHDSNAGKDETLHVLLNLPEADWTGAAIGDVSRCHPPLQELSTWSHGLAFLRWMLQRIIPYPAFLMDDIQVAVRLGVTPATFSTGLDGESGLVEWLKPTLYRGVLSEFRGRRWWRAGIDALIWSATKESPFDKEVLARLLMTLAPASICLDQSQPVAYVNRDYQFVGVAEARDCVRLRPDDWPLFADSAWALRTDVQTDQTLLTAVEDPSEREELVPGTDE